MMGCSVCEYGMLFFDPKMQSSPSDDMDVKKHILAEHYDYLLAQCKGDKELVKKWADNLV